MDEQNQQDGGAAFVAAALAAPVPETPALPPGDVAMVPAVGETVATPEGDRGPQPTDEIGSGSVGVTEDPNVASTVASAPESVMESSVGTALAASVASLTGVSSVVSLPLESRIAPHLEAIYQLAKDDAARLPQTVTSAAAELKDHASDILHKLRNGMSVAEGEIVTKLERLIGML